MEQVERPDEGLVGLEEFPYEALQPIPAADEIETVLEPEAIAARDPFWLKNGFYLTVGWYGLQRFAWEFLKPYATLAGPFNLFHLVCLGLVLYAAAMIRSGGRSCTTA